MRFLVDAQLPPALARWLEANGHQAEHVSDVGLLTASDSAIWEAALERGAVIVTKDEDFAARRALRAEGPAIVWIRLGNARTSVLIGSLQVSLATMVAALDRGESVVEVVQ